MVYWCAIFAMVCWGIAPILAKMGLSNVNPVAGLVLRTLVAATLVTSWVGLTGNFEDVRAIPAKNWILITGEAILATLVGDLAYFFAIKNGDVSQVSFIVSSSPLITMMVAALILGEHITVLRVVGACYVLVGLLMLK
ncbi:MAG: EamA family transporter [Methylocystaceae bacterium]